MKERPILFSGEMVRAILDGRKSQTRRVMQDVRSDEQIVADHGEKTHLKRITQWWKGPRRHYTCPYGQPGDRLWVREAHALVPSTAYAQSDGVQQTMHYADPWLAAIYREGWERSHGGLRWRPSIHMPRWASRITLEITGVRVERVTEISYADLLAEGCPLVSKLASPHDSAWYRDLWNSLNAKRGYGWDVNPWVWVIEFKRAEAASVAA